MSIEELQKKCFSKAAEMRIQAAMDKIKQPVKVPTVVEKITTPIVNLFETFNGKAPTQEEIDNARR